MLDGPLRRCTFCQQHLPLEDFYKKDARGRLMARCKPCHLLQTEEYRKTDKARKARSDRSTRYRRQKKYGIDQITYQEMHDLQNGLCEICGKPERKSLNGTTYSLAVDHDHSSGRIRKLLYHSCNTSIGNLNDDPELLRKAAAYIERFRDDQP